MLGSEQYREEQLELLCKQIATNRGANTTILNQKLTNLGRMMIWGDKHNPNFLNCACENKVFEVLLDIFKASKTNETIILVLGFFSMLLTNLSKKQNLICLLSHPTLLSIQMTNFINMNNQIVEYFINFLKGLARRADSDTINIFFNKRYCNFPLLAQAIRFHNHPESLVRITCRNIVLTLSAIKHPKVDQYFLGFPFCVYLLHQCDFVREYWLIIDEIVESKEDMRYQLQNLDTLVQDHEELLGYLDDLLRQHSKCITEEGITFTDRFIDAFINECLSLIMQSLGCYKTHFGIKTSLLVLSLLLKNITNQLVTETIVLALFGRYYSSALANIILKPILSVKSYDKVWKFKGFWDNYQASINKYCVQRYFAHRAESELNNQKDMKKKPSQKQSPSIESKQQDSKQSEGGSDIYSLEIYKIEKIFGMSILRPKYSHKTGSSSIGDIQKAIQYPEHLDLSSFEINQTGNNILTFLESKDDALMMLTLNLLSAVLRNKNISEKVRQFCRLSTAPISRDFQSMMRIQRILISCLKMFQTDPPCYRICTYKQAEHLTNQLLKLYDPTVGLPKDILKQLRLGLKTSIQRITPYLYGKQWQKSVQLYYFVNSENELVHSKNLKVLGLEPPDEEHCESVKNQVVKQVYDEFPISFIEQIARDFWVYIIIRNLVFDMNQVYRFAVDLSQPQQKQSTCKYEEGKSYTATKEEIILAEYRVLPNEKYFLCEVILLNGFFVIGVAQKVEQKRRYEQCQLLSDRSDPRKLILQISSRQGISLLLPDSKTAILLRKNFDQMKATILKYNLSQLIKEIDRLGLVDFNI